MKQINILRHRARGHFCAGIIFAIMIFMLMASATWATNKIYLNHTGYEDTLRIGVPITIRISIENSIKISRMDLGFRLYSPDGAIWSWANVGGYGSTTHAVTKVAGSRLDPGYEVFEATGFQVNERNVDGVSPDSLSISGLSDTGGINPGPQQGMIGLTIIPQGAASNGKTICIDSASAPPGSDWVFADLSGTPYVPEIGWITGTICWPIAPCCPEPPYFTNCPMAIIPSNPCNTFAYQLTAIVPGHEFWPVTYNLVSCSGSGTVNVIGASGLVTYVPGPLDLGQVVQIAVETNSTGGVTGYGNRCTIQIQYSGTPPTVNANHSFNAVGVNNHFVKRDISAALGADPCSDNLSYAIASGPGSIDAGTGIYEWTPQIEDVGEHDIIVQVSDGGKFARDTFQLTVVPEDIPGNANCTDGVNVGDVLMVIFYTFQGGMMPPILNWADANHDCKVNVGDAIYLINYIFKHGPAPVKGCVE